MVTEPQPNGMAVSATKAAEVIRTEGLTRVYGTGEAAVRALDSVSLTFSEGSFSAVMGASGSGKSTLMHLLAGLDKPTRGSVQIAGEDITRMSDKQLTLLRRRKIGFVFQFFNLLPTLNAEENILLPLKIAGQKHDPARFGQIVQAMGLGQRLRHRPAELSGGQQQRVAIARALMSNPAVVFADEPTGNLDSSSTVEVLALLRDAVDEFRHTIIMVTHEPAAATSADRVIFLKDGQVVRDQMAPTIDAILSTMSALA